MGYVNIDETRETGWKSPSIIEENKTPNTIGWSNIEHLKTADKSNYAMLVGMTKDKKSSKLYLSGFKWNIPGDNNTTTIKEIQIRHRSARVDTAKGEIYDSLVRLKTNDDLTSDGFTPQWNIVTGQPWKTLPQDEEYYYNNLASETNKGASMNTHWGASDIYRSHVMRSNFGLVFQARTGDSVAPQNGVIYYFQVNIKYHYKDRIWIDPEFDLSATVNDTTILNKYTTRVNVGLKNTNNTSGDTPTVSVVLNDVLEFADDGSRNRTIKSVSVNPNDNILNTLIVRGVKNGTGTVTITSSDGKTKTLNITVQEAVTPPTYNLIPYLSKPSFKMGETSTLRIEMLNTNQKQGQSGNITIKTDANTRILKDGVYLTELTLPSVQINAGASYLSPEISIYGHATGSSTISIINEKIGARNVTMTVTPATPLFRLDTQLNKTTGQLNENLTLTYRIRNNGVIPATPGDLTFERGDNNIQINNASENITKTIPTIPVNATHTGTITVKASTIGTHNIKILNNIIGTNQIKFVSTNNDAEYNFNTEMTPSTFKTGTVINVKLTVKNINNTEGYVPQIRLNNYRSNLDGGYIDTISGAESYTKTDKDAYIVVGYVGAGATKVINVYMAPITKTSSSPRSFFISYFFLPDNTKLSKESKYNPDVANDLIFNQEWATLVPTVLPVDGRTTAKLDVKYQCTNLAPNTSTNIPMTSIKLSNGLQFTNGLKNMEVPSKILTNTNAFIESFYIVALTNTPQTITLINTVLGTQVINVLPEEVPPQLYATYSFDKENVLYFGNDKIVESELINVTVSVRNDGSETETVDPITCQLTGDKFVFRENYFTDYSIPGFTVPAGQKVEKKFQLLSVGAGSANLSIHNPSMVNITDWNKLFTATKQVTPTYSYGFIVEPTDIQANETSNVKIDVISTNDVTGTHPTLYLELSSNIEFNDHSHQKTITGRSIPAYSSETVANFNIIPINALGKSTVTLKRDSITPEEIQQGPYFIESTAEISVRSIPLENKGILNLENCSFENNTGANGGAICNRGNLTYLNLTFQDNNGTCPNIYDNGACKNG